MINKKQLHISQKLASILILIQIFLKIIHFSSLVAGLSMLFALFQAWAILLIIAFLCLYHFLLTSIFYLILRILNYTFNLIYR